jgi:hypothetical protein
MHGKSKNGLFSPICIQKNEQFFWSLRMVQGTIKITKNLNTPCWKFMTECTLVINAEKGRRWDGIKSRKFFFSNKFSSHFFKSKMAFF